jgi:hypothetical protein
MGQTVTNESTCGKGQLLELDVGVLAFVFCMPAIQLSLGINPPWITISSAPAGISSE